MRSVLSRTVSSSGPSAPALWPVACAAIRSPHSRANSVATTTSSGDSGKDDGGGPLIDVELPRASRVVPARVLGEDDLAVERRSETAEQAARPCA